MKNHEMSMSFVDQQWIERLAELQDRNSLTDVQAAMYLGIEESEFQFVWLINIFVSEIKKNLLFPDAKC